MAECAAEASTHIQLSQLLDFQGDIVQLIFEVRTGVSVYNGLGKARRVKVHDGREEARLVTIVCIDSRLGVPREIRDLLHARIVVAGGLKRFGGGFKNACPGMRAH